jgi:hypothetical protein
VLLVVGFAVLCFAIWAAWDKHSFIEFTGLIEDEEQRTHLVKTTESTVVNRTIYVIIGAVGLMLFIISLGCRGASRESRCLLTYYAVILLIIMVMITVAGFLATVYTFNAEKEIKAYMISSLQQYSANHVKEKKTDVTLLWDSIFRTFQCCGVNSNTDFREMSNIGNKTVFPETCCIFGFELSDEVLKCKPNPDGYDVVFEMGCYDAILGVTMKNINIVIGIASGLVLSVSLCVILASCLRDSIQQRKCLYTPRQKRWFLREHFGP